MRRLAALLSLACLTSCGGGDGARRDDDGRQADAAPPAAGQVESKNEQEAGMEQITLTTSDDVRVFGTLHRAKDDNDRIVLLFHQARSNRHEYDPIVPQLSKLGFDTLAVDQRSGGEMWDHQNQTVEAIGKSADYLKALPDLQAALDWAVSRKYKTIVAVGSSYSAALVFLLADANPQRLAAIAAFSPGEYLGKPDLVKNAAAKLTLPVYATAGSSKKEQAKLDEVLSKAQSKKIVRYKPQYGVHGASTLRKDVNPEGAAANMQEFSKFLSSVVE